MRAILLFLLVVAGCGSDENVAPDLGAPTCPAGAGGFHGARCTPGVDTECACGPGCYRAHCQCDGWWETDQVAVCCDADGGVTSCL